MYSRITSSIRVFIVFVCAAVVWTWVLPIWQGIDETVHFSYVQYMVNHNLPPKVDAFVPGIYPWKESKSYTVRVSRQVTQYNHILRKPSLYMTISPQRRESALRIIQYVSSKVNNQSGSQNYVGIYPPLYYGIIARILRFVCLINVNAQEYIARLCAALFGTYRLFQSNKILFTVSFMCP